jgi:hypothetical protein
MFCLALLAGWGLDEVRQAWRAPPRRRQAALGIAALLLVVPLVVVVAGREVPVRAFGGGLRIAWLFADPPGEFRNPIGLDVVRMSSLLLWLTFGCAALLIMALSVRRRLGAAAFGTLAVLLVCADLFRAGMGFNPAIDQKVAEVPATGAIKYLQSQGPARFAGTNEIPQNVLPFEFDLYEARGYDLPIVRRYDRLWRREVTPDVAPQFAALLNVSLELPEVTPRALRTLRLLGVTHIVRARRVRPLTPPFEPLEPYPPLRVPGVSQVYDGPDARVYRVHGALPRAFMVAAQRVVEDGDAQLDAVTSPSFDGRAVAITERRLPGMPEARGAAGRGGGGTARITRYEDERVVVRARAPRPGLLVLGDTHFPGWEATVDGREAPIERVDYLFRGVRLPAGVHTVEFRYRPLSWRIGWIVSLVALLGLALAAVAGVVRARRGRGGPRAPLGHARRLPEPEPAGSRAVGRSSA